MGFPSFRVDDEHALLADGLAAGTSRVNAISPPSRDQAGDSPFATSSRESDPSVAIVQMSPRWK